MDAALEVDKDVFVVDVVDIIEVVRLQHHRCITSSSSIYYCIYHSKTIKVSYMNTIISHNKDSYLGEWMKSPATLTGMAFLYCERIERTSLIDVSQTNKHY